MVYKLNIYGGYVALTTSFVHIRGHVILFRPQAGAYRSRARFLGLCVCVCVCVYNVTDPYRLQIAQPVICHLLHIRTRDDNNKIVNNSPVVSHVSCFFLIRTRTTRRYPRDWRPLSLREQRARAFVYNHSVRAGGPYPRARYSKAFR